MGNILDSDAGIGDPPGAQTWTLSLDCRPDALQPLLVCHGKRVILPPHHIYELVRIANAEHTEGTAQIHDRYGDLPTKCLPRAARLRAARLLCRERIHVPPDRDAAGIQSVPVSPAMALYQSNFGCLLIEFMCRARRVQLDIVGNRVRRALQGHPTASLRDSLRLKLVKQGLEDVPGIRGSAAGAMTILKKVRSLADREMVASEKALITNAFATEFEFATYGQLGPAFVAATSGGEIKKTFGTREDELCIAYLGTLWENLKASSVYSSLYRLRKENKSAVLGRLLLAFSASTASFHVLIQTASVLMMMSCENLNDDLRLPWQALNSLNCIRYSNPVQTSREGGRADDIPVATRKSPGVKCSVACAALVDVLATMCSQASNSDAPVPTLIIGFDSASFASLLELLNRCMYCYFARIRNEEVRRDSFDSELLADVHDAVVKLHRSDTSFEQRVSTARTLLKLVRLLKLDPTNPTFHTLYMDSDVLRRDIVNVPEAVHILDLIGYKFATADVKVVVKGISTVQQSNQFRASMVDVDALNQAGHELDLFLRQAWSALLPKLLSVLHFQICLIAKYRTYPAARDVRSADAVKKEYLSSAFQDLVRVIGSGFDDFQESRDPFRAATANWAIKVVCDGMQIFMPKASQQVSFLSRMFDASIPLTPSSSFKRDLVLTQPARKAISDYLFCVSSVSIDPGYLTDLAFGLDEDSWSNLVLDIKSEGSENIVWKRVCRVIADIQVSDSDFARYKNDPVVSPILNKIMRAGSSDAAPMKMATIHKALILLASPFPEAFESTHSTSFLSPKLGTVNSDRFAPAERAARLLFCFQRDLFNRSIVNGTRVDAVSCHPVLEFVRAFLGCTVQQADSISGFDGTISTEVQQFQFRKSLAGAYLPHVLLGIASTSRQFHPESSSLGDIIKMMQQLHASFGGFSGLAEVPLERLGGRRSKEYEYSSIEDILDGGNAVEDILIHPHFDLSVDSKVPEHGDQEKRSRIANSHMMFLLTSHNVSSDLVQLYVENSGAVLEALSNLQKQPQAISSIMAACPVLQRIVSTIVFGEYDMPNFAKAVELPSLYLCTMCGSTLPTIHDLVLHTFGFSSSGSSSTRATICSPSGLPAWFAFLRHLTAWVLAKLARNCVTGVGGDFNVLSGKLDQDTSGSSQGSPSESVQQWLKSILFKGGFDRTQYATELGDADGSCEIRVMKMSEDRRFFADLIDGKESAGALNKAVLDLPQFKGFPHRKSGGDAIAQATRSVVTVLLKHGGLTETARALAKKILDCSDDNKAELVTQPENSDLLKLWSVADSLKGHWVFLHQEGIQSVCIEKNCKQSVIYDSDFYRCSNGHENQQCETEDTLTYEAIRDSVVSKCMLLLNTESGCRIALHPALMRQTSTTLRRLLQRRSVDAARSDDGGSSPRSPSGRTITVTPFERWKMLRNTFLEMIPQFRSMNNPMFHRTISDAIIDFIKDERVDPRELSYSLESVVRRAHRRSQGFEILSQLSHRVPSSLKIAIVVELVSAVRDWPVLPDSIAPHFFDRIESAGVELLGSVRNAYAVVAGRAATLFNQIVNGNKDDSTLSALVLVDFWKIGFRLSDFVLLRSLRFTELLRLDTHRENYNLVQSALRRVFNAVSLLSFCHDRSDGIGVNSENAVRSDGRIDPWQGSVLDEMHRELSADWPSSASVDYSRHEYVIFEILSVLLLSCHATQTQSPSRALDHLRSSKPWITLLAIYLADGFSGTSLSRQLSPRCFRRVTSIASIVFSRVKPERLAEVYFDGANGTPVQLIEDLMRMIGRNTCGTDFDGMCRVSLDEKPETPSTASISSLANSSTQANLRARCAVKLLRSLQTESSWAPLISRVVSLHLTLLNSVIPMLETHSSSSPMKDPQAILDLIGVLRFLGNYVDPITVGSRVVSNCNGGTPTRSQRDQRRTGGESSNTSNISTVVGISKSKAVLIRDSDLSLSLTERDLRDIQAVPDCLQYGSLLLTRQAINSLLFLISLRPSGSADRRRSSVDNSRNAIVILDSDIRFQPSLMFAQLQAYGLKAFLSLLQSLPSLVSQDTLCAIIESPAFVRNLLQVARMPIPLHEASDLQDLEIKCCRLGMLVHDQRVIEQSYGILSIDKQTLRDSMDEHIDWCTKASQMFSKIPDGLELAKSWLVTQRNSVESARLRRNQTMTSSLSPKSQTGDMITRLSALGFPVVVCEKALRLCKGNETLAANWLMDNGAREAEVLAIDVRSTEALANPFSDECEWGTEGVDFFQEMGDGDVARDLLWRLPSDQLDGNFEAESDVYNRLALQPGDVQQTRDSEAVPDRAKSSVPSSSSLKHLSLSLTIDDLREGQAVRISRSWVSARDRVLGGEGTGGAGSGRYMYRWYLNSVQNTWEPFDDNVTAQLEERWRLGDSLCTAILDSEPFMFRLDRMAMYHSLTGYMVRLRRRRVEKSVQSPFQTVANKNEANDQSPVADEILSDEQILERMLDALSSSQRETVERVQLVVADMPKSWVVQALQKNNFDPNLAVEWIFANSTVLENLDKEQAKRREALLNPAPAKAVANSSSDDDPEADSSLFTPLLAYGGAIGTIVSIDRQRSRARVAFPLCSSDSGHPQVDNVPGVLCPLVALEWPDAWVGEEMPNEISQRRKLGVDGLLVDAYVALGIVFARRAVLSIMRLSLSGNNDSSPVTQIPAETTSEPQDENAQPSLTLSKLNLKVIDVISILKLVANDIDHMSSQGVSIWFLLRALAVHPKYSEEMLPFLIDDCIVHLRRSSSRVAEVSTAHPYPDSSQTKEEVYIENANELLVEFDRRSQLKEGHAVVSFWSDPECTSEIAIMSGTGFQSPGNSTGSGFRPFIVRGNRFFVQFGSGQPRPTGKVEFGFAVRVRPLGYRFEDERDILRAPLGWNLLSLLTSNDLIDSCLRHERCHDLVRALIRFLRCSSSPSKVFVTMSLEKLFSRYSEMYIDWGTRTSFLERIGGSGDIAGLQTTRDRVREANMRAPVGSSFSPFLKALEDLLRLTRVIFPQTAFQTYEIDVLQVVNGIPVNPWDMRIAIGKVTAVDVARVEMVLECLYNGRKLPSSQIFALSYEHLNTMALFRLCLKELETSIKLNKQISKWKDERRFWMSMVNTFKDVDYLADILLMLRRSMLDSAFEPMWSLRHKDWESRVREAHTLAQYAVCLRDLEESFRWRDEKDDNRESALVTSWRASRPNWVKTVTTLSDEVSLARVQSSMPSSQEAERAPYWSREANEQLVAYVNALISQNARRLRSLTFVDITEPKPSELVTLYPSLKGIPMPHIRSRFGVLKMINQLVAAIIIPVAPLWNMQERSLGTLMRRCKRLIFHEAKLAILTQSVQRMYSKEKDPQNVILNRHEAAKERSAVNAAGKVLTPAIRHTIFFQLYSQLRLVDAESLRRKGQAWRVKFVGERGHDVGGLFNASLSNICDELMSYRLPLFVPTPNGKHKIGDNREKWMPSPSANDPQHIAWFEFVGKLMGIACLSQNRTLSIDLPSMVWKTIVREPLDLADLKAVDYPVYRTLHLMRRPEVESITEDTFEYVFPDLCFTAPNADGVEVELAPDDAHRQVTWANRLEYACAVEEFRLHELEVQIGAICRGLAQMLPIDLLALFTWQQLEVLVCGNPDIDIQLLREKTIYSGNVRETDPHIQMFWRVIESFSAQDRREFLQFVWGRSRLPTTKVGFGKDAFKISDHTAAILAQNAMPLTYGTSMIHDQYLPVAHTCFFALELPRYSSDAIMSDKLLYAIHNCKTIDADTTQESQMNQNMSWSDGESDGEGETRATNEENRERGAQ